MDNQLFYVIHPSRLRFPAVGLSLQQRRNKLRQYLIANGAQWAAVRSRSADFMKAVQELDRHLGSGTELTDSAFENSPDELLPVGSSGNYDPFFGYYDPLQVEKFNTQLRAISKNTIDRWENLPEPRGEILGQVAHAFGSTFAEAAARKCAVAIDHG